MVKSLVIALCAVTAGAAMAGGTPLPSPSRTGAVIGVVRDGESGEPLGFATVILQEIKRGEIVHANGEFHFFDVPVGEYSLRITYLGYSPLVRRIVVRENDTLRLSLSMQRARLDGGTVVVTGRKSDGSREQIRPGAVITGARLQQDLGSTLSSTLQGLAGISQRSMGGATPRPVVRGLGGDRLAILQDGESTGDLSASNADHAVTIDPLTAERIEVVRGAQALAYTANALGGVVNLVENRVPGSLPDRLHGNASVQGETGSSGLAVGGVLSAAAGPIAMQIEGAGRTSGDTRTPIGLLENTFTRVYHGSVGAGVPWAEGLVGGAVGLYSSDYGVPGGFTGAHPHGVRIEMNRSWFEGRGAYTPAASALRRIEGRTSFTRYHHRELESNGSLGAEFGLLTTNMSISAAYDSVGLLGSGLLGFSYEHRDFAAGGGASILPTIESSSAAYLFEETQLAGIRLGGSLRFDSRTTTPDEQKDASIGTIRERTFSGLSAGLEGSVEPGGGLAFRASLLRTYRPPSIEELFSEGPHLASYSFEVGNPELSAELGFGMEMEVRYSGESIAASATGFRNAIQGFIYSRKTGDTNYRTLLPIYQASSGDVEMIGGEATVELGLADDLTLGLSASYVEGTLLDEGRPLPAIPPFNGNVELSWTTGDLMLLLGAHWATAQNRIGDFETPTNGYLVANGLARYRLSTHNLLHVLVLSMDNAMDSIYRQHLSRVKSIAPEPGRSLRLVYRIYF